MHAKEMLRARMMNAERVLVLERMRVTALVFFLHLVARSKSRGNVQQLRDMQMQARNYNSWA